MPKTEPETRDQSLQIIAESTKTMIAHLPTLVSRANDHQGIIKAINELNHSVIVLTDIIKNQ